jgi:hypothetical protein
MNFHIEYYEEFRKARTLQTEQDNQDSTLGQDILNRTARKGEPGQACQNRTRQDRAAKAGQPV